jgi:hypothetical protein
MGKDKEKRKDTIYSNIESLVHWASSEEIGFAVSQCRGIMEYWVCRNEICFYMGGTDQKIKSGSHPFLIPNIPFFHHSTIPWAIFRQRPIPSGPKKHSPPGQVS